MSSARSISEEILTGLVKIGRFGFPVDIDGVRMFRVSGE
jgi:hypothetical protein